MRAAYDERRLALLDAMQPYTELVALGPSNAGTQVAAWCREPIDVPRYCRHTLTNLPRSPSGS